MSDTNTSTSRCHEEQRHVHELTGSTAILSECGDCHNHRFCTISGEAIGEPSRHVHEVVFRTDFSDGHFHEFRGKSSPPIQVGGGKHIHFVKAVTQKEDGHCHKFQAASLIDSPIDC